MEAFILSDIGKGANLGGLAYFAYANNPIERFEQDPKSTVFDVLSRMFTATLVAIPIQFAFDLLPLPKLITENTKFVVAAIVFYSYLSQLTKAPILWVEQFIRKAFGEIE